MSYKRDRVLEELRMGKLYFTICADTEDNHPNYVSGWSAFGSNYDLNPAIISFEWTKYWDDLLEIFYRNLVLVTWLFRVDQGPMKDNMLKRFRTRIFDLKSKGDEIGIHIHTWVWDSKRHLWRQARDPNKEFEIVKNSIRTFRHNLGFSPLSSRLGWNTMSNAIMRALDEEGILVDATCEPGYKCDGLYNNRDNIIDWSGTTQDLYHPNKKNYKLPGQMKILEAPLSSITEEKRMLFKGSLLDKLINSKVYAMMKPLLPFASTLVESFNISAHSVFYISPSWSTSVIKKIVDLYVKKAKENQDSFLIGYFHPSDILKPKRGLNEDFLHKVEDTMKYISLQKQKVNLNYITLSEIAEIFDEKTCA